MVRFVVIGCSRSGTRYMAKLLSSLGLKCGHERVFNIFSILPDGSRALKTFAQLCNMQGDSSFLAAPFLQGLPQDTVILHQIRHPVEVIRSHMGIRFFSEPIIPSIWLADNHPDFIEVIRRYGPQVICEPTEIQRCMRYWTVWNHLIQEAESLGSARYKRYQVESIDLAQLKDILQLIGTECPDQMLENSFDSLSRKTNSRQRDESISWGAHPECVRSAGHLQAFESRLTPSVRLSPCAHPVRLDYCQTGLESHT